MVRYNIPGLYEAIFNRTLKCSSPVRVVSLLADVMAEGGRALEDLRVLDLGAGNGMVGHELNNHNVALCVGAIPEDIAARIRESRLNALACVAALGFGDIPTQALLNAIDLLETPAYLAFNIKEDFVQDRDPSGFAELIRELARRGVIHMQAYRRYQHRLSCAGEPLYYIAMVATKEEAVPKDLLHGSGPTLTSEP